MQLLCLGVSVAFPSFVCSLKTTYCLAHQLSLGRRAVIMNGSNQPHVWRNAIVFRPLPLLEQMLQVAVPAAQHVYSLSIGTRVVTYQPVPPPLCFLWAMLAVVLVLPPVTQHCFCPIRVLALHAPSLCVCA